MRKVAEEMAQQWQEGLGIQIEVQFIPTGDFRDRWLKDPPHVWVMGWTADYLDPHNFLNDASWRPIGGWQNETYDQLIKEAWKCSDRSKRLDMYIQAEQILIEEAPAVPLAYTRINLLIKPWIKNWQLYSGFDPFFPQIVIEPH
jgi:ABC-type transport system substrate-binding protein